MGHRDSRHLWAAELIECLDCGFADVFEQWDDSWCPF